MSTQAGSLFLLAYPYREVVPLVGGRDALREDGRTPGTALVWAMSPNPADAEQRLVESRPGGVALIVILPPADDIAANPDVVQALHRCRPQGILPYHVDPVASDLAQVLRRPPTDLAAEVTDYLTWRGLGVDRDTTHLIRRIIELSGEMKSITALSRGMYLSRRALGRRLMNQGLPVPSHWLQLGRLLRLAVRLQNSEASVFSIACGSGYPDGFSVSNQMQRLIGFRPSEVREYLGWEWILEAWLRKEAESGGLAPALAGAVDSRTGPSAGPAPTRRPRVGRPKRPEARAAG